MEILRNLIAGLLGLLMVMFPVLVQAEPESLSTFNVLCYHDILDDPGKDPEPYSISTAGLVQQFSWLKEHGYHVISVDDLLAAQSGKRELPNKAILLTFDDGYRGFYTHVYPLLKAFNYPAVLALVGSWLQLQPGEKVPYDLHDYDRSSFLSEEQIREMSSSGLVEIASHSYGLHQGILANPQGNLLPAAVARRYDPKINSYENDAAYRYRIKSDLDQNSEYLKKITGKRPRVLVWPYGRYNQIGIGIAASLGMPITLNLNDGANTIKAGLAEANRWLIDRGTTIASLDYKLTEIPSFNPQRVMQIDLDYVYDPDPVRQEENLGHLIERVRSMHISTVYLQAFADPDGNGAADSVYFPNRHLPMRADLFNRVSWQLKTRAGVSVFAWMPLLAFELSPEHTRTGELVISDSLEAENTEYPRLSPFDENNRKWITELYEDLAKHAIFEGLLFHDDATLNDFEDASPPALSFYWRVWGLPDTISGIRQDQSLLHQWTDKKIRYLTEFTRDLATVVRQYQPHLKTARNLYAEVVLNPESSLWFAQSLPDYLENYDYTALMAMPFMENAGEPLSWLKTLVGDVNRHPGALRKTIFELQSFDWRDESRIDSRLMLKQMQLLQTQGAINFGYYPDDFLKDNPEQGVIWKAISLQDFPYTRKIK